MCFQIWKANDRLAWPSRLSCRRMAMASTSSEPAPAPVGCIDASKGFMEVVTVRKWHGGSRERLLLLSECQVSLLDPMTSNVLHAWPLSDLRARHDPPVLHLRGLQHAAPWPRRPAHAPRSLRRRCPGAGVCGPQQGRLSACLRGRLWPRGQDVHAEVPRRPDPRAPLRGPHRPAVPLAEGNRGADAEGRETEGSRASALAPSMA